MTLYDCPEEVVVSYAHNACENYYFDKAICVTESCVLYRD